MKKCIYQEIEGKSQQYVKVVTALFGILFIALLAAYYMEHNGHVVTGMNNQIVWGIPHVFAIFLIVAASGALNVASIASVFGKAAYKPLAPLSALLAIALLVGGLCVLLLDLGRPDRLIVAMTHFNFKSIFAWNVILYNGFLAIVAVYIWTMMEQRFNKHTKTVGRVAFVWRLVLTAGTGSIFGFLVAREAYDTAILAPLFIVLSFSIGLAIYLLVLFYAYHSTGRALSQYLIKRLKNLLGVFVAGVLFLVAIFHLTNLYAAEHSGVENFILNGSSYTFLFWVFQVFAGSIVPLVLFYHPTFANQLKPTLIGTGLVLFGAFFQLYIIIIGGQAYPLVLFPEYDVSSSFYDGKIAPYFPSLAEILLGTGGVAVAAIIVLLGVKLLKFLPQSLAEKDINPHYRDKT